MTDPSRPSRSRSTPAPGRPGPPGGRRTRITRRGRLVLLTTALAAVAAAIAAPFVLGGDEDEGPRHAATLTVPEGWRASQVYAAVDTALHLKKGTTGKKAAAAGLALPGAAGGNPEGYLYPATYPITEKSTPERLLSTMVDTANRTYAEGTVAAGAEQNAVSRYQLVTVASIVQSEAATDKDMARVARVVYNRLDEGMPLQMDSTLNYGLGRSTLHTKTAETRSKTPYNTYVHKGLPPTPIANPGAQALRAATRPAEGDWLYFVTVKRGDTRFTSDYAEHQKNVAEFNKLHSSPSPSVSS
ncbi:endolytic transglycosylase MltG [Streptomyces sp. SID11385]|uniref:endolytic transglycosylase MltG n=1 Tax=Streptomyces sp. SID11385 TaxID=2706031 RepID=UPI0013CDDB28|nr:endolytic transglycosylase MltG [Streptomyces sp. SID11385]NEA38748.1 endolytic transglycosylase MltG [Streptomyces sp. SID11385]